MAIVMPVVLRRTEDAADGGLLWRGRVGGNFSASPIVVGGTVVNVSGDGEVVVIADGESFEVLGRTPLGEPCRSSPARRPTRCSCSRRSRNR